MEITHALKHLVPSSQVPPAATEDDFTLNVMMVYQDFATRKWAAEMWERVAQSVGGDNIQVSSWRIGDLVQPGSIADAVWSAAQADVIMIAVRSPGELPVELCVWIDAWLPRRTRSAGALVALIGLPPAASTARASHIQEYLCAVARRGRLDFMPREREVPAMSTGHAASEATPEPVDFLTPAFAGSAEAWQVDDACAPCALNG
jgi:hypothetical protein